MKKFRIHFSETLYKERYIDIEAIDSSDALDVFYDITDSKRVKLSTLGDSQVEFSVDIVKEL